MSEAVKPSRSEVKEIFLEALELRIEERAAFLDERCEATRTIRVEVESLLRAHEQAGEFLSGSSEPDPEATALPRDVSPLKERIGPYKLLQVIGEGGFGTVYLAEQESPVRRRVAIKVIRLGMDTRQVVARFEAERQALAMMDHPGIAKVFDAGQTDDRCPYFVMELVKGVPVTDYCDTARLGIRARLELFAQVCHAVQHAHQKGLIHRDIKPSNILVSTQDDRPLAKVIDFGIAKATQSRLTEKTLFTEFRQLIGTPEYMSPEQAEGSLDIDTRTDVYALGVLMYELITGTTPFDARELRSKAYGEMQRLIREVDPPRPSTRLSALRDKLPGVAAQRAVEPRRLRSLIRGELDWIVMKAMEKDRARRYETASALAADVQRYLADEPVLAGPPSRVYRVRKFARRHRGGVGAAAAILAVLIVALAVTTRLYIREADALRRAVAAEAEARRQRDEAVHAHAAEAEARALSEQADNFVRGMFESIDPVKARGNPVLVRDVLDSAVAKVDGAFPDRPVVEGRLRRFFGETYLVLGLPETAREQLEAAERLLSLSVSQTDREYVRALVDLGRCYQFLDRVVDAQGMFTRADALASQAFEPDSPDAYIPKSHLASILLRQNRHNEASVLLDELLAYRMRALGPAHTQTLTTMGDIAWVRQLQGRFAEAEAILLEAVPAAQEALGADHPRTLALMNNLVQAQADNGKLDEAERTQREVVEAVRRIYGPDHRNTLATGGVHAHLLQRLGRFDESEAILNDSIERLRRSLGEDHANTLLNRTQRGMLYVAMNRLDDADRELSDVAERLARVSGPDHPETLSALGARAQALVKRKDYAQAETAYRDLEARMQTALGTDHPNTLLNATWLGFVLGQQDRWQEAEPILAAAYAAAAHAGITSSQAVFAVGYGECLARLGRRAEAEPVLREADDVLSRAQRPEPALRHRLAGAMSLAGMATTAPATQP